MTEARLLNGNALSDQIGAALAVEVEELKTRVGRSPGLAVILVGDNPASRSYVKRKAKVARECGFETFDAFLPGDCSEQDLEGAISQFNSDPRVDGILLQLPLPDHLDSDLFLSKLSPSKDVDGLHLVSQGKLLVGESGFQPCTPLGVLTLIDLAYQEDSAALPSPTDLSGKSVVVIGRSRLVGKPLSLMLLERNATVTILHSRTQNPSQLSRQADIVIAAVGKEHLVTRDWIRPGAVVIDVGINRNSQGKLTGDVDFDGVRDLCSAITPVPGGVGPMTVISLMKNTFKSYQLSNGLT